MFGVGGLKTLPIALPCSVHFYFESGGCKGIIDTFKPPIIDSLKKGNIICKDHTKMVSNPTT